MSRRARLAVALIAVFAVGGCSVARSAPKPAEVADGPVRRVLPNGIPVIVEQHRGSDVAAVQLWVRAGGRDETATELGLAHYLEHMLFKGTPNRPGGVIEREVEGSGGGMNASTSWDSTVYRVVLPAEKTAEALDILSDIAVNANLDAATLDAEKQVVLEEIRRNEDSPRRALIERLYAEAFAAHPYGRPVSGTPELIRALTRETLVSFYRRHYGPESFAVVVVGPVQPEGVFARARETFGRLPRTGAVRLPPPPAPAPRAARVDIERPGAAAYVGLAWQAPRLDHAEMPAVALMAAILGGGRSSRLVQSLRERRAVVSAIDADYSALQGAGLLTIVAQTEPDRVTEAESEIVGEIRRVRDGGVTDAERRRALTAAEAQREFSIERAEGRARALGRAETIWRLEDELLYVDRLRSVTPNEIRAVARRYLDPERYVRVALVPAAARR